MFSVCDYIKHVEEYFYKALKIDVFLYKNTVGISDAVF